MAAARNAAQMSTAMVDTMGCLSVTEELAQPRASNRTTARFSAMKASANVWCVVRLWFRSQRYAPATVRR
ncbi:hypothetical protein P3T39_007322 [Kitasatospora sp. GP82]|nr:hypothetical protein [Kitasatospora sp. GP82]